MTNMAPLRLQCSSRLIIIVCVANMGAGRNWPIWLQLASRLVKVYLDLITTTSLKRNTSRQVRSKMSFSARELALEFAPRVLLGKANQSERESKKENAIEKRGGGRGATRVAGGGQ